MPGPLVGVGDTAGKRGKVLPSRGKGGSMREARKERKKAKIRRAGAYKGPAPPQMPTPRRHREPTAVGPKSQTAREPAGRKER